jgi:sulfide:quinone oxidoreductase
VDRFRVLICGGGIAATEGLLRLRRLLGDAVNVTLLAPNDELRYRPVAVQEPFSRPGAKRYPLR